PMRSGRGAWRAGDACERPEPATSPAYLLLAAFTAQSIGAPGFEPGTSATRTQRSTGLSHAPRHHFIRPARTHADLLRRSVGSNSYSLVHGRGGMGSLRSPRRGSTASGASRNHHLARSARPTLAIFSEDRRGFEFSLFGPRTGWDGLASLAASREYRVWRFAQSPPAPLGSTHARDLLRRSAWVRIQSLRSTDGVGWARFARRVAGVPRLARFARSPPAPLGSTHARDLLRRSAWVRIQSLRSTDGVGFEPTRA